MKRTFLVEIESNGHPALWCDEAIQYRITMSPSDSVFVTDITATHAKEREVIEGAMDQTFTNGRRSAGYNEWFGATEVTEKKARELRALMEEKS